MAEIIGVRFKTVGKVYYFDPNGLELKTGEKVIVETARDVYKRQLLYFTARNRFLF